MITPSPPLLSAFDSLRAEYRAEYPICSSALRPNTGPHRDQTPHTTRSHSLTPLAHTNSHHSLTLTHTTRSH
eukprot:1181554-Prorocentrum_minimum.AAC.4